jgi:tRNA G18 (ribose-2'-O)-methylase SpoU
MLEICAIQSIDDPRLALYRTMRRQFDHFKQEIFVAEGEKVVRRLLEGSIPVLSLLMPEAELGQFETVLKHRPGQITAFTAPKSVLEKLTGFPLYGGILALAKVPAPSSLENILALAARPCLLVALDGLSNAENLGVMVRNAVAFGADGLILGPTCAPPYLRRAVRSSMGTVFKSRHAPTENLAGTLRELQGKGVRVIAAHPHTDERVIFRVDFKGDCCLVFGSEGTGISPEVLKACDERVAIPMGQGTDSLNVASASSVFLYEARRQREL